MKFTTRIMAVTLAAACWPGGLAAARSSLPAVAEEGSQQLSRDATPRRRSAQEVEAKLSQASKQMEHDDYQGAAQTLRSLRCLRCDARVDLLLAAALEGSGDATKAQQVLQIAHSVWPSNNSIATSLAREYLLSGLAKKAALALSASHVSSTTPLQELALRVNVYLAVGKLIEARRVAEIAHEAYRSEQSLLLLANVLQMQGRAQDVIGLLEQERGTYASSSAFLVTLAESEYDIGRYQSAQADLESAIPLGQNLYQAHYLLGNTLFKLAKVNEAIAEYRMAIHLSPETPRTYFQLARALVATNDDVGAESSLDQALAKDAHYSPAYSELAKLLMRQNHFPEAVKQLNLAIQYNPTFESAYYLLVRAYVHMGEQEESQAALRRFTAVRDANLARVRSSNRNRRQGAME